MFYENLRENSQNVEDRALFNLRKTPPGDIQLKQKKGTREKRAEERETYYKPIISCRPLLLSYVIDYY